MQVGSVLVCIPPCTNILLLTLCPLRPHTQVDGVHSRMRAAQKRLRHVMKKSGGCKCSLMLVLLGAILVAVILIAFKIIL